MERGNFMGLIDKELQQTHVKEERLMRFTEFVREQKAKKSPGMAKACLQSEGYRDFYGKVVFGTGMHNSLWILPGGDNPKALLYTKRADAEGYAKTLQKILRDNGYPFSRAWAEQVAVSSSKPHPFSKVIPPTVTYEKEERYIIQMIVK